MFKWFNASVGCIIRAGMAVSFWVQINLPPPLLCVEFKGRF